MSGSLILRRFGRSCLGPPAAGCRSLVKGIGFSRGLAAHHWFAAWHGGDGSEPVDRASPHARGQARGALFYLAHFVVPSGGPFLCSDVAVLRRGASTAHGRCVRARRPAGRSAALDGGAAAAISPPALVGAPGPDNAARARREGTRADANHERSGALAQPLARGGQQAPRRYHGATRQDRPNCSSDTSRQPAHPTSPALPAGAIHPDMSGSCGPLAMGPVRLRALRSKPRQLVRYLSEPLAC